MSEPTVRDQLFDVLEEFKSGHIDSDEAIQEIKKIVGDKSE